MWDWCCWFFCSCFFNFNNNLNHKYIKNHHHQQQSVSIQTPIENDTVQPLSHCEMFLASLLPRSCNTSCTFIRYLVLALFSPLLLPLICATFPFLCALEVFFRLCHRRWRKRRRRRRRPVAEQGFAGDGMIRCDDGGNGERLLQRYLEDQLMLVAECLYDCGDYDDEEEEIVGAEVEHFDSKRPSL